MDGAKLIIRLIREYWNWHVIFGRSSIAFQSLSTRAWICDIAVRRRLEGDGRIRLKKSPGSYQRGAGNLAVADALDHRRARTGGGQLGRSVTRRGRKKRETAWMAANRRHKFIRQSLSRGRLDKEKKKKDERETKVSTKRCERQRRDFEIVILII